MKSLRVVFSLRGLMIFVAVCGISSAYIASDIAQQQAYNLACDELSASGATIIARRYAHPWWWFGDKDFFSTVIAIEFDSDDITDADIHKIDALTSLIYLRIRGAQITDSAMASVARQTSLQVLVVDCENVTTRGIQMCRTLTNLEELSISSWKVTDECIKSLAGCKHISVLRLAATAVTDVGVRDVVECWPHLAILNLRATDITDESMRHIVELNELIELDVQQTTVTEQAAEDLGAHNPTTMILF